MITVPIVIPWLSIFTTLAYPLLLSFSFRATRNSGTLFGRCRSSVVVNLRGEMERVQSAPQYFKSPDCSWRSRISRIQSSYNPSPEARWAFESWYSRLNNQSWLISSIVDLIWHLDFPNDQSCNRGCWDNKLIQKRSSNQTTLSIISLRLLHSLLNVAYNSVKTSFRRNADPFRSPLETRRRLFSSYVIFFYFILRIIISCHFA